MNLDSFISPKRALSSKHYPEEPRIPNKRPPFLESPVLSTLDGIDEAVLFGQVAGGARQIPLRVLPLHLPDMDEAGVLLDGA